jgi:hypothetical protein
MLAIKGWRGLIMINKSVIFNNCENSIEIIKEIEDIPSYKKYS